MTSFYPRDDTLIGSIELPRLAESISIFDRHIAGQALQHEFLMLCRKFHPRFLEINSFLIGNCVE